MRTLVLVIMVGAIALAARAQTVEAPRLNSQELKAMQSIDARMRDRQFEIERLQQAQAEDVAAAATLIRRILSDRALPETEWQVNWLARGIMRLPGLPSGPDHPQGGGSTPRMPLRPTPVEPSLPSPSPSPSPTPEAAQQPTK